MAIMSSEELENAGTPHSTQSAWLTSLFFPLSHGTSDMAPNGQYGWHALHALHFCLSIVMSAPSESSLAR